MAETPIALYIGATPGVASPNKLIANSTSTSTPITTATIVSDSDVYINLFYDIEQTSLSKEDLEYIFSLMPEFMFNVGNTALPWEPYTGGVPAANPYEGEINVTVQGGNLFDSSQLDDENNFDKSFSGSGYWIIKFPVPSEDITVSVGKISNVNDCYFAVSSSYGVEDVYRQWFVHSTATNGKTSVTYSKNEHGEYIYLYFRNMMAAVQKALNECDYIQIEVGDTATQYMPYKTPQTLTAQTPGGLPGIPVSSGGNYTDESGQQWICDEVDFSRGKYVKRPAMKSQV